MTALIDGPLVSGSVIWYAFDHPKWRVIGGARQAVVRHEPREFQLFLWTYWLAFALAVLQIFLFVARCHERCVYSLRQVDYDLHTDYRKGVTRVIYAHLRDRALHAGERILVYSVILFGGAGFFAISRYLFLVVVECVDGVWLVHGEMECLSAEHSRYLLISASIFIPYMVVSCRMSASFNDLTYLSEVEDELPSTGAKLLQLMRAWGPTVVKRAGLWTRHPEHGWKFGLSARMLMLANWGADMLIEDSSPTNPLRWISVAVWVLTAFSLLYATFRYQPMAEPFSSQVMVLCRALLSATYLSLAGTCALVTITGTDTLAPSWRRSAMCRFTILAWLLVVVALMLAAGWVARRWPWQEGNETIASRQAEVLSGSEISGGQRAATPGERRAWGLGSLRQPSSPGRQPSWNRRSTSALNLLLGIGPSPSESRNSSPPVGRHPVHLLEASGGGGGSAPNSPLGLPRFQKLVASGRGSPLARTAQGPIRLSAEQPPIRATVSLRSSRRGSGLSDPPAGDRHTARRYSFENPLNPLFARNRAYRPGASEAREIAMRNLLDATADTPPSVPRVHQRRASLGQ
jgi:hypothetical protein